MIGSALIAAGAASLAAPVASAEEILRPASYPGMTTYKCRTPAISIYPGQNTNLFGTTPTCPNAERIRGPGDASVFSPGSGAQGFITRFKPDMVEILPGGELRTPRVDDLHLHHVVWIHPQGGPTFGAGEEKTIATLPQGYGKKVSANGLWGLNYMIHNLTATEGRRVYVTWEIDWVPETTPPRTDVKPTSTRWLDVAGAPQIYPVFDAERRFDLDGDGLFTFPDDVPTDPSVPGYEERRKISRARSWRVPSGGVVLVFGAGHLHPGGRHVDLRVARDGPDPGSVPGDHPSEIRHLFRSKARYYEPAGAVSWDVSMGATRRNWRIKLKAGDVVYISATYDVSRASWYESMGILPISYSTAPDPAARDPFEQTEAVRAMYNAGGILTHGRLPENIDNKARKKLGLANPRKLRKGRRMPASGVEIESFFYGSRSGGPLGGFSATRGFPQRAMRPPVIRPGRSVTFTNLDALPGMAQNEQVWHSITSCKPPCNRKAGIGYPLAAGPVDFDSGQLGYGTAASAGVTTGSNSYTTPPLGRPGTYTYFCRIHPFMRGSVRVKKKRKRGKNAAPQQAPALG